MKNKKLKQTENKRDLNGLSFRESVIEVREEEGKAPVVRMSVSSETPVLTYVRMGDDYIRAYEILDHNESSIDRSRCSDALVIQDTHYGDQIGLIRAPIISDKKLGGIVEFCAGERAKEIGLDAANGLRKNTSVGYRCDPEKYVVEGQKDGYPVVRSLSWCPHEASFVNVPADTSVGVGRALEETQTPQNEGEGKRIMTPKEMAELFKRAALFGIEADAVQALIDKDQGRAELDALIVERQASQITELRKPKKEDPTQNQRNQVVTATPKTDVPEKEMRKYSVVNVIRSLTGDRVDIGREREISDQLGKERNRAARGIIIPHAVLGQRAFTVAGTYGATVATNHMPSEFIDLLRTRSILGGLGVRFLPGLVGNVAIPKMTAGATGYWVTEASAITGSAPTLGQVTGTPHTAGVMVDISRLLLNQSTPAAEMITRDELIERLARTIQIAVFAGTGHDGQPSAITTASGINNPLVTQGTPTMSEILGFPGAIFADSAAGATMKWAMTAEVWAKLAATATNGNGSPLLLDPVTGKMLGYAYEQSEDLPANSLWFGDWSTVNVGVWGNGVDLNVDDKTLSSSGGLRLVALQDVDVMVRLGQKLAYSTTVTI